METYVQFAVDHIMQIKNWDLKNFNIKLIPVYTSYFPKVYGSNVYVGTRHKIKKNKQK